MSVGGILYCLHSRITAIVVVLITCFIAGLSFSQYCSISSCFLSAVQVTKTLLLVPKYVVLFKRNNKHGSIWVEIKCSSLKTPLSFSLQAFNKSLTPFQLIYDFCVWLCVCVIHLLQCDNLIFNAGEDTASLDNKWMMEQRGETRKEMINRPFSFCRRCLYFRGHSENMMRT